MKALIILKDLLQDGMTTIFDDMTDTEVVIFVNEAVAELEELNNRSCEGCKHFEEINDRCNRGVFLNWKHEIDDDSFYCSRYEAKS